MRLAKADGFVVVDFGGAADSLAWSLGFGAELELRDAVGFLCVIISGA